jgi:anti-anti-sigma factor
VAVEPPFATSAEVFGDSVVVHVEGDIDVVTASQLRADVSHLVDSGPDFVLDLSAVPFMDSVGISAVLATREAVLAHGGSLSVRNPSQSVQRVLDLTGLTAMLTETGDGLDV